MNDSQAQVQAPKKTKYCSRCGKEILEEAVICPHCGCQVAPMVNNNAPQQAPQQAPQPIIINNTNTNVNTIGVYAGRRRPKNKWVALILCIFLGYFGAHKFYEGKTGMGILYLLTLGLCGIGWVIDTIVLLFKPNHYYV